MTSSASWFAPPWRPDQNRTATGETEVAPDTVGARIGAKRSIITNVAQAMKVPFITTLPYGVRLRDSRRGRGRHRSPSEQLADPLRRDLERGRVGHVDARETRQRGALPPTVASAAAGGQGLTPVVPVCSREPPVRHPGVPKIKTKLTQRIFVSSSLRLGNCRRVGGRVELVFDSGQGDGQNVCRAAARRCRRCWKR
jgi:hypothetical protein